MSIERHSIFHNELNHGEETNSIAHIKRCEVLHYSLPPHIGVLKLPVVIPTPPQLVYSTCSHVTALPAATPKASRSLYSVQGSRLEEGALQDITAQLILSRSYLADQIRCRLINRELQLGLRS